MILSAISKQFTLRDDGLVYFQPDNTNPLPGAPLARLLKGESLLSPDVALIDAFDTGAEDRGQVRDFVATWLKAHIYTVLEPLFKLISEEVVPDPVQQICLKLFSHVGILPRGDVEDQIALLDQEMRKTLRERKVRMGPLLIFIPDLNKPAAVHLRALLWSLSNDAPLPAPLPRDGAMSVTVDAASANPDFYRAIGYPLYGPRAIRIDMLDRVINAVYDAASGGKFQAKHTMAEWMGCPISDLYAILEAMGHKRLESQPVTEPVVTEDAKSEEPSAPEVPVVAGDVASEPTAQPEGVAEPTSPEADAKPKEPQKKPELDFFHLRRGKAHSEGRPARPHHHRPRHQNGRDQVATEAGADGEKAGRDGKKPQPFPKERYGPKGSKPSHKSGPDRDSGEGRGDGKGGDRKDFKKKKDFRKDDKREARHEPRVYSAEAAGHDNPFAVLQNLKLKG